MFFSDGAELEAWTVAGTVKPQPGLDLVSGTQLCPGKQTKFFTELIKT